VYRESAFCSDQIDTAAGPQVNAEVGCRLTIGQEEISNTKQQQAANFKVGDRIRISVRNVCA
jgi:hypothetical protein